MSNYRDAIALLSAVRDDTYQDAKEMFEALMADCRVWAAHQRKRGCKSRRGDASWHLCMAVIRNGIYGAPKFGRPLVARREQAWGLVLDEQARRGTADLEADALVILRAAADMLVEVGSISRHDIMRAIAAADPD